MVWTLKMKHSAVVEVMLGGMDVSKQSKIRCKTLMMKIHKILPKHIVFI